jgi:hypothetical protein
MQLMLILLCLTTQAAPSLEEYELPQQATVYYFHSHQCPPCRIFSDDYKQNPQLRQLLSKENGINFIPMCVADSQGQSDPKVSRFAAAMRVTRLPTFCYVRRGVVQARRVGYSRGEWRSLAAAFAIDDDTEESVGAVPRPVRPQQNVAPSPPAAPQPNAAAAPQPSVSAAVQQQLEQLARDLQNLKLQQQASAEAAQPSDTPEPVSANAGGLSAQWGGVAKALGAAALTVLAPHVAIPTSLVGVAGVAFQALRRYRQAKRDAVGSTPNNPIVQRTAGTPPATPQIRYVETIVDYKGEAFVEALQRVANANRDDQTLAVVRQIEGVAAAIIDGQEAIRRPSPPPPIVQ